MEWKFLVSIRASFSGPVQVTLHIAAYLCTLVSTCDTTCSTYQIFISFCRKLHVQELVLEKTLKK